MKMHNKLQLLWMLLIFMVPMLLMVPVANALPPANDDFANATVINSLPFQDTINTSEASADTNDPVFASCIFPIQNTVWYAGTPGADKVVEANTFGSDYDTTLTVVTGSPGNFTLIGSCNDDAQGSMQSQVTFDATAGVTYYFMVGSKGAGGGNLVFTVEIDTDGDGAPDAVDNCPDNPNGPNLGTCISESGIAGATCHSNEECATGICSMNQEDTDSDGVGDVCDSCPDSILDETVIIGSCDSGVINRLFDDGCTMSDLIAGCSDGAKNHGKFVSCVSHLTNDWKHAGLIRGNEKGAIQRCAAKYNKSKKPKGDDEGKGKGNGKGKGKGGKGYNKDDGEDND